MLILLMFDVIFWICVVIFLSSCLKYIFNPLDTLFRIRWFFSLLFYDRYKYPIVSLTTFYELKRKIIYCVQQIDHYSKKIDKLEKNKNYDKDEMKKLGSLISYWYELQDVLFKTEDEATQINNDFITGKNTLVKLREKWEDLKSGFGVYITKEEKEVVDRIGKLNSNYMNEMRDVWGYGY